jgi:hypothetical protein
MCAYTRKISGLKFNVDFFCGIFTRKESIQGQKSTRLKKILKLLQVPPEIGIVVDVAAKVLLLQELI